MNNQKTKFKEHAMDGGGGGGGGGFRLRFPKALSIQCGEIECYGIGVL